MKAFTLTAMVSAVVVLALTSSSTDSAEQDARLLRAMTAVTNVDCAVSSWTYGTCNTATNEMIATRKVTVAQKGTGQACPSPLTQTLPCYCETTAWANSSACDSTGHQTMAHNVTSTLPCTPVDLTKQVTCPFNCVYSYTTDAACNANGSQNQTLVITAPAVNGGTACPKATKVVAGVCKAVNCVYSLLDNESLPRRRQSNPDARCHDRTGLRRQGLSHEIDQDRGWRVSSSRLCLRVHDGRCV